MTWKTYLIGFWSFSLHVNHFLITCLGTHWHWMNGQINCGESTGRHMQRARGTLLVFTLSNVLLLITFILELVIMYAGLTGPTRSTVILISDSLMAISLPLSWFYLIFFAGGMQLTGPFVSMIKYMLVQDMRQFSIIYLIFIYGFSQGKRSSHVSHHLHNAVSFFTWPAQQREAVDTDNWLRGEKKEQNAFLEASLFTEVTMSR